MKSKKLKKKNPLKDPTLPIRIGIVAPSSPVPKIELDLGVAALRQAGFEVEIHPTTFGLDFLYSGSDLDRAKSLLDFAVDPNIDVIWCARGGYGATHLLPILSKNKRKFSKKTFVGFSDATALLQFFRTHWKWKTLHGPMPSLKTFGILPDAEWELLLSWVRGKPSPHSFPLRWIHRPKKTLPKKLVGPLLGGNLSVWNTLSGTPFQPRSKKCILFFEEIQENFGKINRMMHQLDQTGQLKGVVALVLGDFTDCRDTVSNVLSRVPADLNHPLPSDLQPLRETLASEDALLKVFQNWGQRLNIPVLMGVPAGHGTGQTTLGMGETYWIDTQNGELRFG